MKKAATIGTRTNSMGTAPRRATRYINTQSAPMKTAHTAGGSNTRTNGCYAEEGPAQGIPEVSMEVADDVTAAADQGTPTPSGRRGTGRRCLLLRVPTHYIDYTRQWRLRTTLHLPWSHGCCCRTHVGEEAGGSFFHVDHLDTQNSKAASTTPSSTLP